MTEHEKQRYQVYVKHPVYNELQLESAKQDKPISQLADQALVKYLQNAFLVKPGKPRKPRRQGYFILNKILRMLKQNPAFRCA